MQIDAIYQDRFASRTGLEKRDRVWRVLCRSYFDALIGPGKSVLDIGCGYGEFINNVTAAKRFAVDTNPDTPAHLNADVRFSLSTETLPNEEIDVVFASNFIEHLPDKQACNAMFAEVRRVLRPRGRFIVMGPNIRFAYREYWDWFDHYLPLSDRSLCEGLRQAGFGIVSNTPRFLPVTMEGNRPTADWMIRAYLALPLIWHVMGKQFLVVAERP